MIRSVQLHRYEPERHGRPKSLLWFKLYQTAEHQANLRPEKRLQASFVPGYRPACNYVICHL